MAGAQAKTPTANLNTIEKTKNCFSKSKLSNAAQAMGRRLPPVSQQPVQPDLYHVSRDRPFAAQESEPHTVQPANEESFHKRRGEQKAEKYRRVKEP